ncbi:hypothetical protein [Nocardia farcinica]|uniref:hypothetical protein n=1 Tax=Nocardia farcinica TaxID=37329 RepID=UPI0024576DEE|nr:hypothetical protein [Nocardia farcinica]
MQSLGIYITDIERHLNREAGVAIQAVNGSGEFESRPVPSSEQMLGSVTSPPGRRFSAKPMFVIVCLCALAVLIAWRC